MEGKSVRVKTWREFKQLAVQKHPKSIVYNIEQGLERKNLTSLRLILPAEDAWYLLLDFAKEGKLKETGIPLRTDKKGNIYISEDDVKDFLSKELGRELLLCSFWTI